MVTDYLQSTFRFYFLSKELKDILGEIPLNAPDVSQWLKDYLTEQTALLHGG